MKKIVLGVLVVLILLGLAKVVIIGVSIAYNDYVLPKRMELANPFQVGQRVSFSKDFANVRRHEENIYIPDGGIVVDLNEDLVRVKISDGRVLTMDYQWLEYPDYPAPITRFLTDEWVVGNQFVVRDKVCLADPSINNKLPLFGTIVSVNDEHIVISEHDGPVHWSHYIPCR